MRYGTLLPAVVITTLAVFLTGCSRNPVAPTRSDTAGAPGAGSSAISVVPDDPSTSDGGTPGSRTVSLVATDESVVNVGRWTLWIRKNSLRMPATITLRVTDPEAMDVQITVSPPEANDFQSPVVLTANMSDDPNIDYNTATMLTWNGTWQQWTDVAAHQNQQNIVAHFGQLPTGARVADGADKWKNKMGS